MDYLVIAVIAAMVLAAAGYIYKAKKSGKKCIGCPDGCSCGCGHDCHGCGTSHSGSHDPLA